MTDHALTPHTPRPPLRPRSLTDLVELVPYLLGFHPRDSLVLVALRGVHRRVGVTMRVDLPQARQCEELPGSLATYLRREEVGEALALIYGGTDDIGADRPDRLPDAGLVRTLASGLAGGGLTLVDALYVGPHRWWSYACDRPECCPPQGRALPRSRGRTSPAVAAATYAGLVALPSREALEQTLEPSNPVPEETLQSAEAAVRVAIGSDTVADGAAERDDPGPGPGPSPGPGPRGLERWRQRAVDEIARAVDRHGRLPDDQVARFLVALRDGPIRDACCDWVEGERGERALALWRHLATRAVPPYDVPPLALVAWSAWHTGAGPLARIAVDRALAREPGCRLALLLEEALDRGVNPSTVRPRPRGRRRRSSRCPRPDQRTPGS